MIRPFLFFSLFFLAATLTLAGGSGGITSRVRITADESNKNWETLFFGDRLKNSTKGIQTDSDESHPDEDAITSSTTPLSPRKKLSEKRKTTTVEYHIIQESSEQGDYVRKIKKRIVTEPPSTEDTKPERHR